MSDRFWVGLVIIGTVIASALIGFLLHVVTPAHAADNGQIPADTSPAVRSWFKTVRSPHGVPCCDIADGHRTQAEQRPRTPEQEAASMSEWWAVVDGEWRQVPQAAVIYNAGNPVGEPIVWFVRQGPDSVYIRCFVPGGGV